MTLSVFFLRRWKCWSILGCLGMAAGLGLWLTHPPLYQADVSLVHSASLWEESTLSGLSDLNSGASQFGISLGGGPDPLAIFPDLLRSRRLGLRLLKARFLTSDGDSIVLLDSLTDPGDEMTARVEKGFEALNQDILRMRHDRKSGVLRVLGRLPDPVMAAGLVEMAVRELETGNRELHLEPMAANVSFIAGRLEATGIDLEQAEDQLLAFRKKNRSFSSSPELLMEQDRLQRAVLFEEQVYTTLKQQLELAQIEEVRNTPALLSIDSVIVPTKPLRTPAYLYCLCGLLCGLLICLVWTYLKFQAEVREDPFCVHLLSMLGSRSRS